jgi:hypothetical protein
VDARDADIDDELDLPPEVPGRQDRLLRHRQIGGAGTQDDDELARGRGGFGRPRDQSGHVVVHGVGQLGQDGGGVLARGPREEDGPAGLAGCVRLREPAGDGAHLLRGLALAVDGLGVSASRRAGKVELGDPVERRLSHGSPRRAAG